MPSDMPPALLPGRSAWGWMRIAVACMLTGLPVLALIVLGAMLPQPYKDLGLSGLLLVGLGICGVGGWAAVNGNAAAVRERDAGYTTLYGMFIHLWQLDHRTGEVVRRPGEREVRRRPRDGA